MKRLSAILAVGLFFSGLCFAQTQTGPASYNVSKSGLTISHASLSFSRRVKITNLSNNMEVIATVDGRISPGGPAIADISRDAGNAIRMSLSGYTTVRIEIVAPETAAASPPVSVQPAPEPPPPSVPENPPPPPAPQPPSPAAQEPRVETIQLISPSQPPLQPQYIVV
ncbi:MAG: septal ring lytic transglycosylase RlpA family protein, partial [Treponema sp.]|nr:septal ring lytic transglycosylase RlpA family protein [Treponema sp.]